MSLVVRPERDHKFELIRKFDRVIFNMDLIKSIIKYEPDMTYQQVRQNLYKYGKEYGIRNWYFLPREKEEFQVRNVMYNRAGDMSILPMPIAEDRLKGLTSCGCDASLIQRILWYDGGNGKIISRNGWFSHWENSKLDAVIYISQSFNHELFKDWNHMYYTLFLNHDKKTNQLLITPYNKQTLVDMGLNNDFNPRYDK